MMRKSLLSLFAIFCVVCCFTACDDDANSPGGWESLSKTYENKSVSLMMDSVTIPVAGKSLVIEALSAEKAKITLNNVIPESKTVVIDAALKVADGNAYALTGECVVGQCVVSVNGSVKDGVASVVYKRKVTSPVSGHWKLRISPNASPVYAHIVTGNAEIDALINSMVAPLVGDLIGGKVSAVNVYLPENGLFDVSWRKLGDTQDTDLGDITKIFGVQYCVIDGKMLLAIDKNYIDLVVTLLRSEIEKYGISVDEVMKLLVDLGGYYALPLNVTIEGDQATFYLDKSLVLPILDIALPFVKPLIPENFQELVNMLLGLLPNAQTLDLGLVFTK